MGVGWVCAVPIRLLLLLLMIIITITIILLLLMIIMILLLLIILIQILSVKPYFEQWLLYESAGPAVRRAARSHYCYFNLLLLVVLLLLILLLLLLLLCWINTTIIIANICMAIIIIIISATINHTYAIVRCAARSHLQPARGAWARHGPPCPRPELNPIVSLQYIE